MPLPRLLTPLHDEPWVRARCPRWSLYPAVPARARAGRGGPSLLLLSSLVLGAVRRRRDRAVVQRNTAPVAHATSHSPSMASNFAHVFEFAATLCSRALGIPERHNPRGVPSRLAGICLEDRVVTHPRSRVGAPPSRCSITGDACRSHSPGPHGVGPLRACPARAHIPCSLLLSVRRPRASEASTSAGRPPGPRRGPIGALRAV
jgi:hypothetical protein